MIVTKSYDEKNHISIEDINQPFVYKLHLSFCYLSIYIGICLTLGI